jgi:exopolyphosphatase/guanosine-5'-triphosphate,3'-diphosphate pyrophosphatase
VENEDLREMRVAVVDVGSNTIRLLVAAAAADGLTKVHERTARVGLGAEIELYGSIAAATIDAAAVTVGRFAEAARELGSGRVVVVAASPGRQAKNGAQLVSRLEEETGIAVQVLSREEEARLAWRGALSRSRTIEGDAVVCDVGGGSTQVAFGTFEGGPRSLRSFDIGSLRLTTRLLANDPPCRRSLAAARDEVARELDRLSVPASVKALAVGGSARATCRIVGKTLGEDELADALRVLRKRPSAKVATAFKIDPTRARTVAAGVVILAEIQRRVGRPLEVVPAGLREGLALSLSAERSAA